MPKTITINGTTYVQTEGEGSNPETSQDYSGTDTSQAPSLRRDMRVAIWNTVYQAGQPISLLDICKALKVKKAPWMRQHVNDLVNDGYLVKRQGESKSGMLMYFYEVKR
jgi:hypothetical protein